MAPPANPLAVVERCRAASTALQALIRQLKATPADDPRARELVTEALLVFMEYKAASRETFLAAEAARWVGPHDVKLFMLKSPVSAARR
jgi:hypothetical protein